MHYSLHWLYRANYLQVSFAEHRVIILSRKKGFESNKSDQDEYKWMDFTKISNRVPMQQFIVWCYMDTEIAFLCCNTYTMSTMPHIDYRNESCRFLNENCTHTFDSQAFPWFWSIFSFFTTILLCFFFVSDCITSMIDDGGNKVN